jgi:hypothetical protein
MIREKNSKNPKTNRHMLIASKTRHLQLVQQYVDQTNQKHALNKRKIKELFFGLKNHRATTSIKDKPTVPSTLKGYLLSSHSIWYWIIIMIALITTLLVFTVSEEDYPIVFANYLLGAIFVLGLPGYNFIKALFPTKELDRIERLALSLVVSLVIVSVSGLILNYTPWGIRSGPITLSLLILTTVFATIALIREQKAEINKNQTKLRKESISYS